MIKIGIIGVGGSASMHVDTIITGKCPGLKIVAMADRKEARRK